MGKRFDDERRERAKTSSSPSRRAETPVGENRDKDREGRKR